MRLSRRRALGLAGTLLLPPRAADAQPSARTHALVVGINDYRVMPLAGCINDARLLADALAPMTTSLTTLLDAAATRATFLARWRDVAARCEPGDRLFLSFSGHGGQRPELRQGSEADGHDEFLIFRDFHEVHGPNEILLDNEMEGLLAEQSRRGVEVLFLADCCHSGGTTRSVDSRADQMRFRTMTGHFDVDALMAAAQRLPPPPPPPASSDLERVLFLSAGTESELIPEILWQGRRHGALSVAFATALSGAADRNRDGSVSRAELYAHIVRVCRGLAESRQHPEMTPRDRSTATVFTTPQRNGVGNAPAIASLPGADPPIRLRLLRMSAADAARLLPRIRHAVATSPNGEADLTWDARTGEAVSQLGDVLTTLQRPDQLAGVVERVRVARRLTTLTAAAGLDLRLLLAEGEHRPQDHDAAHRAGTRLRLEITNLRLRHFVLFNIAGNGIVQPLFPPADAPGQEAVNPDTPPDFGVFEAKAPFGTDLVVGVAASISLRRLAERLESMDQQSRAREAMAAIEDVLKDAGDWQIGIQTLVTRA
jgi:hypothetical protein